MGYAVIAEGRPAQCEASPQFPQPGKDGDDVMSGQARCSMG
jgi:hypothetical protein